VPNKILKGLKQQGNFSPIQAMKITCPWKISNKGLVCANSCNFMIFLASSLVVSHWQRDYDTIFLLILTKP
jgi:hypothetical protein